MIQVMRRTQIYLEEAQTRRLQQIAAARGKSTAWVVRDAVDKYLTDTEGPVQDDPIREFIGSVKGLPEDAAENHDRYLYGVDE
jgi:hypothetical protein